MPNLRLNRTKSLKHSCDAHVANFSRKSVNDTPLSSFKQVCGICNSDFSQSGDCIECLLCKSGFHASCVSLTRKVLELISTAGDCIKWFCSLCLVFLKLIFWLYPFFCNTISVASNLFRSFTNCK